MSDVALENPHKLRDLATWYREYADRAGAPWIWDARLQTADKLERQAAMLEVQDSQRGFGRRIG